MKPINWNNEKNIKLNNERGISFEIVARYIANKDVLEICSHPNQDKYPGQQIFVINIEDYIYLVPFVETEEEVFLKTIFPSRKATKQYLEEKNEA